MKAKRYGKSLKVETILGDLLQSIVDKKKNPLLKIELAWNEVLPESISRNCQPSQFRKGILTVKCSNSLWKSELMFYKFQIIDKINSKLGKDLIFDIIFR
jgi:hypothetical protein